MTRTFTTCLIFILIVSFNIHATGKVSRDEDQKRIALVIGINQYNNMSPLRSAVIDASKIAARLRSSGYDRVLVLSDAASGTPPTKQNILDAMQTLQASLEQPVSEFLFFFAGHGLESAADTVLCPTDYIPGEPASGLSLASDMLAWATSIDASKTYMLIDSCRTRTEQSVNGFTFPNSTGDREFLVLTAATYNSGSFESTDGSGGYFTRVFLDSLDTGDPTIAGMIKYITYSLPRITLAETGTSQIPGMSGNINPSTVFSAAKKDSDKDKSSLIVRTKPEGAAVRIGDNIIGTAPLIYTDAPSGTIRVSVKLGELEAAREVLVSPGSTITVELELGLPSGKVFFASSHELIEYSVDGGPPASMSGQALAILPAGRRHVRLIAEDYRMWTGWITVVANETIQVSPEFGRYGTIKINLPPEARMHVFSHEGSISWLVEDETELLYVPTGLYGGATVDNRFFEWKTDFKVSPGSETHINPNLQPTQIGLVTQELRQALESLPAAKKTRTILDRTGWITTATGLVLGVAAVYEYSRFNSAYNNYKEATLGADFSALRAETEKAYQLTRIFGIASGGFTLAGIIPLSVGPRPKRIENKIEDLENNLFILEK